MKPHICLLICIFSFFVWSCNDVSATQAKESSKSETMLNLTLGLDKDIYEPTEPIEVTLRISNTSDERVVVKKRLVPNHQFLSESVRDVVFLINHISGNLITFNGYAQVPVLSDRYFFVMGPNESFEHIYSDIKVFYDISEPGEYTIQAIYENHSDPSNDWVAWKGTLQSNTVTFIIEP